jgi:hypothetical protein
LTVHDVVPDLHVLEDLRESERARAEHEAHGTEAEVKEHTAGGLASVGSADDLTDVRNVALAEVCDDFLSKRIELAAEGIGFLLRQGLALGLHGMSFHRSSSRSDRGTEMHN